MIIEREDFIKVYNALGDNLSKDCYKNLIMYSITNDGKYIDNLARNASVTLASEKIRQLYKQEMFCYEISVWQKIVDLLNDEMESNHVIICGALGTNAQKLRNELSKTHNLLLCDQQAEKKNCLLDGIRVITYKAAAEINRGGVYVILSGVHFQEIREELIDLGIEDQNIVFVDVRSYKTILKNIGHKYVLDATCKNLMEETYFDKDIMMPDFKEVFIDCGFYDGESSRQFTKWCAQGYEKIVAFEPDKKNYEKACKVKDIERLELHNLGCWSEKALLSFKSGLGEASYIDQDGNDAINAETIDHILQGERCTFIKMDIEGAELNALKGAKNTIIRYHPKLAISIYHKSDDIIKIPIYILTLYPKYRLYIRHYTFNRCDTVLYAVLK